MANFYGGRGLSCYLLWKESLRLYLACREKFFLSGIRKMITAGGKKKVNQRLSRVQWYPVFAEIKRDSRGRLIQKEKTDLWYQVGAEGGFWGKRERKGGRGRGVSAEGKDKPCGKNHSLVQKAAVRWQERRQKNPTFEKVTTNMVNSGETRKGKRGRGNCFAYDISKKKGLEMAVVNVMDSHLRATIWRMTIWSPKKF